MSSEARRRDRHTRTPLLLLCCALLACASTPPQGPPTVAKTRHAKPRSPQGLSVLEDASLLCYVDRSKLEQPSDDLLRSLNTLLFPEPTAWGALTHHPELQRWLDRTDQLALSIGTDSSVVMLAGRGDYGGLVPPSFERFTGNATSFTARTASAPTTFPVGRFGELVETGNAVVFWALPSAPGVGPLARHPSLAALAAGLESLSGAFRFDYGFSLLIEGAPRDPGGLPELARALELAIPEWERSILVRELGWDRVFRNASVNRGEFRAGVTSAFGDPDATDFYHRARRATSRFIEDGGVASAEAISARAVAEPGACTQVEMARYPARNARSMLWPERRCLEMRCQIERVRSSKRNRYTYPRETREQRLRRLAHESERFCMMVPR